MVTTELKGVYLRSRKGKARDFASSLMKEQDSYLVCMQQSKTAEATVCVKVGDEVAEGTVIGKPSNRYGVFVYSPVSGKVVNVIQKLSMFGKLVDHVLILADKKNKVSLLPKINEISRKTLLERLMISGIVDGVGEPSYTKFVRKPMDKTRLVISCVDNDPFISSAEITARENPEACVKGAELFMTLSNAKKCEFLFTGNQTATVKVIKKYLSDNKVKNIKVRVIQNIYPLESASRASCPDPAKRSRTFLPSISN